MHAGVTEQQVGNIQAAGQQLGEADLQSQRTGLKPVTTLAFSDHQIVDTQFRRPCPRDRRIVSVADMGIGGRFEAFD